MEEKNMNYMESGIVKISDEVVSVIAGIAATEVEGIVGISSGIVGGFTDKFTSKKNQPKGVRVNITEGSAQIDIFVAVEYGQKIHEVAEAVQKNVKRSVETMTGLDVSSVNVLVQNIVLKKQVSEDKNLEE